MITAIIPARGGSKGISRKNVVELGGFPLLAYSIAACEMCKGIDRIIVSTEDEEIAKTAKEYGAEVPFMRPVEFAQDMSTDVDFLRHFFDQVPVQEAALIRPTTPFRDPLYMEMVIERYFQIRDNATGLKTVNEINENPYKVYRLNDNVCRGFFESFEGKAEYTNLPRQTFPQAYIGNGYIDIVKRETIALGTTFGNRIYAEVSEKVIDIDSPFDLKIARLEIQENRELLDFLRRRSKNE